MKTWVDFRPLKGKHGCDNCGEVFDGEDISPIENLFQRVEPGGIMPSGECPECGALCYPVKKEEADDGNVSSEGVHEERGDTRAASASEESGAC